MPCFCRNPSKRRQPISWAKDITRGEKKANKDTANGYEPMKINTAVGKTTVYKSQLRDTDKPFCSKLSAFFKQNTEVLQKLAVETYARGLSTRDIKDTLRERMLAKIAISKLTKILFTKFEQVCIR